jgi:hypothetical protein
MAYAADAVVLHAHPLDPRAFWKQHFDYGRGAWRFHRKRARRKSGRLREELGFYRVLGAWARRGLGDPGTGGRCRMVALLALWQVANAAGFAYEAATQAVERHVAGPRQRVS